MSGVTGALVKAGRNPSVAAHAAAERAAKARSAIEGTLDARRLLRDHPRLVPPAGAAVGSELLPYYEQYVAEVSSPDHAISWESVRYLFHLCTATRPKRALDLGSGFSSYLLRQYAASAGEPVEVVSVDDSEEWMPRTRRFLAAQGHHDGQLRLWSDFVANPGQDFDVIFHDLAGGELRNSASSFAARLLSPRGLIVFDDAHHSGHRRAARDAGRTAGLATYSLRRWTGDSYGRFAMLGAPASKSPA